jgi:hypothetical protein
LNGVDVDVVGGKRIDLRDVLEGTPGRFAVVASGPAGLADDVRAIVAGMAKTRDVKLYEEYFACWISRMIALLIFQESADCQNTDA